MAPSDEVLRKFLRLSSIGYAAGAVTFAFGRKRVETSLASIDPKRLDLDQDFWHALGTAYMSTITALAWLAGDDRRMAEKMTPALLVAKGTTASLFAARFIQTRRPSYLLSALTDGGLFAAMALLWRRSRGPHLRRVDNVHTLRPELLNES